MAKPLVIMVGADKGGVGKTTVSRALDDYMRYRQVGCKIFDGEWPAGDLRQFTDTSEIVDMQSVDDQMRVFDRLAGVTLIDIKAGLFTDVLESLGKTGLLDDVRAGRFNLALLHVLGPSAASLSEVAAISQKLGAGAHHLLVKNYINESGYKEWESDPRFAGFLNSQSRVVTIPHLEARACTEVQRHAKAFGAFIEQSDSRILVGYVRAWLREAFGAFTAVGLQDLIDQTKG
jgi:MinD-like ATPase involved in chromosome partitioning or flagellar assembly